MSTALSAEQSDLRQTVGDLLDARSPEPAVRRAIDSELGYDPSLWGELASMGLLGLCIPEEHGGTGAGAAELAVVAEQMGRALMCGPYLSTAILTPHLLLALDNPAECADVLPAIARGEMITAVAFAETGSARPPEHPSTIAEQTGSDWSITGEKAYVLDAALARRIYVQAESASGPAIFAVDVGAPGLTVSPSTTVDATRRQATVTLRDTPGRLVGPETALAAALDRAGVALLAEQAGGALHAAQMAADYARTRYQFGRAIGSFQAIKHLCVDMLLEAQSALSAARHVAAAFDAGEADRLADLALAQAYCSDAFVSVAADNIQAHGGIGFTWEHPAHLYLRRARTDAQIFGDPAWHRERYVRIREELS